MGVLARAVRTPGPNGDQQQQRTIIIINSRLTKQAGAIDISTAGLLLPVGCYMLAYDYVVYSVRGLLYASV